jgi:hypothetical protein
MNYLSYSKSSILKDKGITYEKPFAVWADATSLFLVINPQEYWQNTSAATLIAQTEARYNIPVGSGIPSPCLDEILSLIGARTEFTIEKSIGVWMVHTHLNSKVTTGAGELIEVAASALISLLEN